MTNSYWKNKGKTVEQLIAELRSFGNQDMEVRISLDDGDTSYPISLVGKVNGKYAVLMNCEDVQSPIRHNPEDS